VIENNARRKGGYKYRNGMERVRNSTRLLSAYWGGGCTRDAICPADKGAVAGPNGRREGFVEKEERPRERRERKKATCHGKVSWCAYVTARTGCKGGGGRELGRKKI